MKALLLGNGKTRLGFDLVGYKKLGYFICGCNALYRDFWPDLLCVVDQNMRMEVTGAKVPDTTLLLWVDKNRKPWRVFVRERGVDRALGFHDERSKAGPTLGRWLPELYPGMTDVYLIGMDLGTFHKGDNNNIYQNTRNYRPSWKALAHIQYTVEDETAWKTVFSDNPGVHWHWLKPPWRALPAGWRGLVQVHESKVALDTVLRGL
jgi:hypothetical protein